MRIIVFVCWLSCDALLGSLGKTLKTIVARVLMKKMSHRRSCSFPARNVMATEDPKSPSIPSIEQGLSTTTAAEKAKVSVFATPDRDSDLLVLKDTSKAKQIGEAANAHATVTPPESSSREPGGKQVRFDQEKMDETDQKEDVSLPLNKTHNPDSPSNNRGLVSRRGGRYGSPGRVKKDGGAVLEYKTFRSPQRKREVLENDTIPSLCSSSSGLQSNSSSSGLGGTKEIQPAKASTRANMEEERPMSISCDTSQADTTSPLTSHDAGEGTTKLEKKARLDSKTDAENGRRSARLSPSPPHRDEVAMDKVSTKIGNRTVTSFGSQLSYDSPRRHPPDPQRASFRVCRRYRMPN